VGVNSMHQSKSKQSNIITPSSHHQSKVKESKGYNQSLKPSNNGDFTSMNNNVNASNNNSFPMISNVNQNIAKTVPNPFNYNKQVMQGSEVPTVEEKIIKSTVEIFK
jgi:hypothetical protein